MADNGKAATPDDKQVRIELGYDDSTGMVLVQLHGLVEVVLENGSTAKAKLPAIQIPIPAFIQTAVTLMNQMLMKIAGANQSAIQVVRPGQLPGDLRGKKLN